MDTALRARLLAQIADTPVDWLMNAQAATLPRVVLQQVSGLPVYDLDGPTGLERSRVQVDCYAATVAAAKALARAVDAALSGWHAGDIRGVFRDSMRDLPTDTGSGETAARVSLDYIIHHQEN